jgi:hypothetical protein
MPLTPNGKVDRRALPEPDDDASASADGYTPPKSPLEIELARIWGDLLEIERVGVHDNFFDLGGHSLLATRVVSRVQQDMQVGLKIGDFFETPTISELAERIEDILWIASGRPGVVEEESQEREEGRI